MISSILANVMHNLCKVSMAQQYFQNSSVITWDIITVRNNRAIKADARCANSYWKRRRNKGVDRESTFHNSRIINL